MKSWSLKLRILGATLATAIVLGALAGTATASPLRVGWPDEAGWCHLPDIAEYQIIQTAHDGEAPPIYQCGGPIPGQ